MSRIVLEYSNCFADRLGEAGLTAADLERARPRLREVTSDLAASSGTGWERWRRLPFDPVRGEHTLAVMSLVDRFRDRTDNLIVLGIGGSALGNIALQSALNPLHYNLMPRDVRNGPRLFVLDNVDPTMISQTITQVHRDDPGFERTLVNVVSKSGETAETAAQFLIVRRMLESVLGDAARDHIVATTDPAGGTLRAISDTQGYATLPVPEGVGGRFSVLSPVGLFSAAMCGLDIDAVLDGAALMDERCSDDDIGQNPAALLAWLLITLTARGQHNHVLMPYANALLPLADWYRQLWAESLGKRVDVDGNEVFVGPTPLKALGATDQHSQIQLYREGPNDKVVGFIEVEQFADDRTIQDDFGTTPLSYLRDRTLAELLTAEKRATEFALCESGRPNYTIRMPQINAHTIGQFIQLWQMTTAYAGRLLNINAYDQPAVETGKLATFGLMGRTGYEAWQAKVDALLSADRRVID